MEKIFKLQGVLKNASQQPVAQAFVAVVDDDFLYDDLIGVGCTDDAGKFSISFLQSEFCQDTFDIEKTPDIKIVVSAMFDKVRKAIFERSFPTLDWSHNAEVDLGDIVMEGVDMAKPMALEGVEPIPSYNKRAKRLNIDDEMVAHCLAEVAPIVENLTGWRGLLDDLKVEVADSLAPYMLREFMVGAGKNPNSAEAKFTAFFMHYSEGAGAGCALYDPHIHTVIINRSIMKQVGIEGLKVICGHELVHVGQMKNTLGLKEFALDYMRTLGADPTKIDVEKVKAQTAYMTELEGYAQYIQNDFLQKYYYRMPFMAYHASTFEQFMRAMMAMGDEGVQKTRNEKAAQYTDGLEVFRKRQVGDKPARFEFDANTLPNGAFFIAQAKEALAQKTA